MADKKPRDIQLHAAQPKTKFAFDESKPLKFGYLNKQGKKLKSMKKRFCVLYPNFLVYYKDIEKWQYDQTVGGLGGRNGAIKLTGGRVISESQEAHCAYPIHLYAPDVHNVNEYYTFDSTSMEERKSWIDAITKAIKPKDEKK